MSSRSGFKIFTALLVAMPLLAGLRATAQAQASRAATAATYLERGNAWFAKGEWARAMADFDLAIASDPNLAGAYYNHGAAWCFSNDFDSALTDFDRALQPPRSVR